MDDGHEIESLDNRYLNQPRHANFDSMFNEANNVRYTNHLSNEEDLSSTSSGSTSSIPVLTERGMTRLS